MKMSATRVKDHSWEVRATIQTGTCELIISEINIKRHVKRINIMADYLCKERPPGLWIICRDQRVNVWELGSFERVILKGKNTNKSYSKYRCKVIFFFFTFILVCTITSLKQMNEMEKVYIVCCLDKISFIKKKVITKLADYITEYSKYVYEFTHDYPSYVQSFWKWKNSMFISSHNFHNHPSFPH